MPVTNISIRENVEEVASIGLVGDGFIADITLLIKTYPWQTVAVIIGIIAIIMNVRSTRQMVRALQLEGRK